MNTHNLIQGSPEWHAFRAAHFTASDAPAMMGVSPYKTRNELLREKATGISAEVDAATQRRFDDGHKFEALARPLAEEIIGAELYPVVGSEGKLAASFDGLTMLEDVAFEHKTLNDTLRACVIAADLPKHYRVQMEQQLMVAGAPRCLFMATKWVNGELAEPAKAIWYESDAALAQEIAAGWAQFERDLDTYQPAPETTQAVGAAPDALPALRIEVTGMVTASNLAAFRAHALAVFEGINTDLETDDDFASADKTAKWCSEVESRLDAAKQHALSQTASIDELFRTIDAIKEEARQKRLTLEKLVKQRKDSIRLEKISAAQAKFAAHVAELQEDIAGARLNVPAPDFGGAIKGLKTLASVQNAIDTALANGKIAADAMASDLVAKLAWHKEYAVDQHNLLFPDLQQLIAKPMDDFQSTIQLRIAQHQEVQRKQEELTKAAIEAAKAAAEQQTQKAQATPLQAVAKPDIKPEPETLRAAVVEHQDEISAFMHSRDFGKDANRIRAVLVEFVKFQAAQKLSKAA